MPAAADLAMPVAAIAATGIALTSGPEKIAATRAVLRSGLVSSLVTDNEVAAAVLD